LNPKDNDMSHTVTVATKFKSAQALRRACKRLKIAAPIENTTVKLYSEEIPNSTSIKLKDWHYPLAINAKTGEAKFDNYNGRWGKQEGLDLFTQAYAAERVKIEAEQYGREVTETKLKDGSVKLTVAMT
jgi:hypothetical protein